MDKANINREVHVPGSSESEIHDRLTVVRIEDDPTREVTMLPEEFPRRRFDVHEYHRMGEVGLLTEDDRVELIRGEIVDMNPIGILHLNCVTRLNHMLVEQARGRYLVSVQNPISAADESEPEPDFSLLRELPKPGDGPPTGENVLIAVEVSDTTLDYDRNVKLPLYAETGIVEVWVVDLTGKKIEVYSQPDGDTYREKRTFGAGEEVISATLDGLTVPVNEVLA